jgi:hypothetical protein
MSKLKNNKNIKNIKTNKKDNENIKKDNENIKKDNEQIINDYKKLTNGINEEKIFIVNNIVKNKQYIDDELFDINYDFLNNNLDIFDTFDADNIEKPIVKKSSKKNVDLSSLIKKSNPSTRNRSSSLSNNDNKDIYKKIEDKNIFLTELIKKQLIGIPSNKKLNYNDIKRISKFIKTSIFDKKKCSLWDGYITNLNEHSKGTYINFYFNKKKIALHRLLYINYIGQLSDNEYLKFSCENKGKCCNIYHMKKYTYTNKNDSSSKLKNCQKNNNKNNDLGEPVQINIDKKKLIVEI